FQENPKHQLMLHDIIAHIARSKHQEPSDLTVFLLLDGIHKLMENSDDGFNKSSKFYSFLTQIAINIITSEALIIGCCFATSMKPIRDILARSSQLCIQLPIPQLKAPSCFHRPVFNMEKPLVKILVEDMGGNGRALEELEKVMLSNIDDSCVSDIIYQLLRKLECIYSDVLDHSDSYKELLQVILSNTPLSIHYPVPGTNLRPGQFAEMSLIRFEAKNSAFGRLTCPYVWLWLMAHAVNDPILLNWRFDYYNEIQHIHKPAKIPPGAQTWQHFKWFVADFRVLKSVIYKENVSIHTMHPSSAFDLHKDNDIYFKSKPPELVCSSYRVSTKSSNVDSLKHENGTIDATDGQHLILNSEDAPAGNVFCYIAEETSTGQEKNITEVLQLKKHDNKTSISLNEYLEERSKAAGVNDIFLLLTTGKSQIDISQLPARSGIVHQNNWKEYFGPFAGRAFIYANIEPPDINTVSRSWLSGIDGIGRKYADLIIKNRPYQSLEDCHQKTGISHKILMQ
ncbi:8303_t:CDS:1, partial [Gigaspora rosea]